MATSDTMERGQDVEKPFSNVVSTLGTAFNTKARTLIVRHEGQWQSLYRDNSPQGWLTTGCGHLVPDANANQRLPWCSRLAQPGFVHDVPATPAEINRLYAAVMAMPPGLVASAYAHVSPLRLSLQAVSDLLDADLDHSIKGLRTFLPFDTMPESAQLACLDICHQAGVHGFQSHFPKLVRALIAGDFNTAAKESHRPASSASRNADIAALFLSATKS